MFTCFCCAASGISCSSRFELLPHDESEWSAIEESIPLLRALNPELEIYVKNKKNRPRLINFNLSIEGALIYWTTFSYQFDTNRDRILKAFSVLENHER